MLIPSPSMCFIIQDEKEDVSASGIVLNHQNKRKASHGTIYALNTTVTCPHCTQQFDRKDLKEGDRVLFSRYIAEQVEIDDMKDKAIFSLPLDAILAKIS